MMMQNASVVRIPGVSLCHTGGLLPVGLRSDWWWDVVRSLDATYSLPCGCLVRRDEEYGRDCDWAFCWVIDREPYRV